MALPDLGKIDSLGLLFTLLPGLLTFVIVHAMTARGQKIEPIEAVLYGLAYTLAVARCLGPADECRIADSDSGHRRTAVDGGVDGYRDIDADHVGDVLRGPEALSSHGPIVLDYDLGDGLSRVP